MEIETFSPSKSLTFLSPNLQSSPRTITEFNSIFNHLKTLISTPNSLNPNPKFPKSRSPSLKFSSTTISLENPEKRTSQNWIKPATKGTTWPYGSGVWSKKEWVLPGIRTTSFRHLKRKPVRPKIYGAGEGSYVSSATGQCSSSARHRYLHRKFNKPLVHTGYHTNPNKLILQLLCPPNIANRLRQVSQVINQ